jgi:hypothetical protein
LTNQVDRSEYDSLGHGDFLREYYSQSTSEVDDESVSAQPPTQTKDDSPASPQAEPVSTDTTEPSDSDETDTVDPSSPGQWSSEKDPSIDEFLQKDVLEEAWSSYRKQWRIRAAAVAVSIAVLVLSAISPAIPVFETVVAVGGLSAIIVVFPGLYVQSRLEVDPDYGDPPEAASVGYLRPGTVGSFRRRGSLLLGVALSLTVLGALSAPHPWASIRLFLINQTIGSSFVQEGMLGAPKLIGPLNTGLTLALVGALVLGTGFAAIGLSAQLWIDHYTGTLAVPVLGDLLFTLAILGTTAGVTLSSQPVPVAIGSIPYGEVLGFVNGNLTATVVGMASIGLLLLVDLLIRLQ